MFGGLIQRFQGQNMPPNQQTPQTLLQGMGSGGILTKTVKFKVLQKGTGKPVQALIKIYGPLGVRPVAEGQAWTVNNGQAVPTAFQVFRNRHTYEVIVAKSDGTAAVVKRDVFTLLQDMEITVEV